MNVPRWPAVVALALLFVAASGNAFVDEGPHQSTTGPVPPPGVEPKVREPLPPGSRAVVVAGVPAYEWRHGCGPTALGMIFGYYDLNGFDDLFPGDASTQTEEVNQGIASQRDPGDPGHYEDYSLPIDDPGTGYLPDASEPPSGDEHDCVADFMKTSWSAVSNYYGWSHTGDMSPAFLDYLALRYPEHSAAVGMYTAYNGNLSWEMLTTEIGANRPMVFLVDTVGDGATDHFVTVVGYRDDAGLQYGCLDTWYPADVIRWCDFAPMGAGQAWGIYSGWIFDMPDFLTVDPAGGGDYMTIQEAIDAAGTGDVLTLAAGTYTGPLNRNLDFGGKDIIVRSAAGPAPTIIDCEDLGRGFNFHSSESNMARVEGVTIKNGTEAAGGGIRCFASASPTIRDVVIEDCTATGHGGGVVCALGAAPSLTNVTIRACWAGANGGGVHLSSASPELANVTLYGNGAADQGGGISCGGSAAPSITNTIVAQSVSGEGIYCEPGSGPVVEHSCIYGNAGGDGDCSTRGDNIFVNPLFCDAGGGDLTLRDDSRCLPENNAWGELVGAHGPGACPTGVPESGSVTSVTLHPASPNPFGPATSLAFELPAAADVNLRIYDVVGRLVRTLLLGEHRSEGRHTAGWDARDDEGLPVASGVYFYLLDAAGQVASRKVILVR